MQLINSSTTSYKLGSIQKNHSTSLFLLNGCATNHCFHIDEDFLGSLYGIRTRISGVKDQRPNP